MGSRDNLYKPYELNSVKWGEIVQGRFQTDSISVLVSFSENPLYVEQQGHMNSCKLSYGRYKFIEL